MARKRNAAAQTEWSRDYVRRIRQQYRQHLVKAGQRLDDGRVLPYDYNPVLDDPDHPDNPRHWTHGTTQGYRDAGCKCPPDNCTCPPDDCDCTDSCALAGRRATAADQQRRLTSRLVKHRTRAAGVLAQNLGIAETEAAAGADAAVATHRVVSKFYGTVDYQPIAVRLALRDWGLPAVLELDDHALNDLVDQLVGELQK